VVTEIDAAGNILWANDSCRQAFGLAPDELIGRSILTMIHPEDVGRAQQALVDSMSTGRADSPVTVRVNSARGGQHWFEANASLYRDGQGRPTGALIIARDIEDRQRQAIQLQRHMIETQALNQLLTSAINSSPVHRRSTRQTRSCSFCAISLETPCLRQRSRPRSSILNDPPVPSRRPGAPMTPRLS